MRHLERYTENLRFVQRCNERTFNCENIYFAYLSV